MCVQKLETIIWSQTSGYGTCDCKRIFVAVTGVITVTLGMNSDLQGSRKDIEKSLDTELLRSYAYWMGDAVTGISKKQDEADALKNLMTEISFIHL